MALALSCDERQGLKGADGRAGEELGRGWPRARRQQTA